MPSDYDKIRADNILEYGQGTRHLSFLGRLYTDRTHFVFELLQNAEDAGASRVLFQLFENRLEVFHDGRLFNEKDVRGICGVGEGTKAEDLTQIGKFGIGFKSVYTYTSTPEVHSGDESFRIENYVRPYAAGTRSAGDSWTTLFVFPYNAEGVNPEIACREISERLSNLSARTLLFLRKIKEIEYGLPDGTSGVYLRDEIVRGPARQVTVIGQNNGKDEDENWLIFERYVKVPNPCEGCPESVPVEIGFRLENNEKDQRESIVRLKDSPLFVSFPTEKKTQFGFLIQGHYKTTPARDNIPKDDNWNVTLVRETARLLVDVLPLLKDMGLLTVSLLEALPIRMDYFSEDRMFLSIVSAVRNALMDQELLPADDGTFVAARNAKLARGAELRKLLNQNQLRSLFQSSDRIKWLAGTITQDLTSDLRLYLMEQLNIELVRPEKFAEYLTDDFLEKQSDEWIIDFYSFLGKDRSELWKKPDTILRKKKILRLENNLHVIPFKTDGTPNAYLPSSEMTNFPTIKRSIFADKTAADFLECLGIIKPDLFAEIIEFILPKYAEEKLIDFDENIDDLKKIEKLLNGSYQGSSYSSKAKLRILLRKSRLSELEFYFDKLESETLLLPFLKSLLLPSIHFLRAFNGRKTEYKAPKEIYCNSPKLHHYFQDNQEIWYICDDYPDELMPLFNELGMNQKPKITKRNPDSNGLVIISKSRGYHERGLNNFDPDIKVDGLERALANPAIEKSAFIWNSIAIPNSACIRGVVETSKKQTYENSTTEDRTSGFGCLLIDTAWLPGSDGRMYKPSELTLDDLPESFVRDGRVADQLSMKKDIVAKLAEEAGISQETIKVAKELEKRPDLLAEFMKKIQPDASNVGESAPETESAVIDYKNELEQSFNRTGRTELDDQILNKGNVKNAERRRDKIYDDHRKRLQHEPRAYERRKKTIRTLLEGPDDQVREYLTQMYGGKCQICDTTFPERDGRPFFVANYIVPRKVARAVDTSANALCLCADHFAKWQHGAIESKDVLSQIESFKTGSEGGNAEPILIIKMCGQKCEIVFKEKHLLDLQELLRASE